MNLLFVWLGVRQNILTYVVTLDAQLENQYYREHYHENALPDIPDSGEPEILIPVSQNETIAPVKSWFHRGLLAYAPPAPIRQISFEGRLDGACGINKYQADG